MKPLRVIIVGGGFAAVQFAKTLRKGLRASECEILLFNRENHMVFHAYGQKTCPGRCPEQELIALCTLMFNQGPGGLLLKEIPGILNICADCEPMDRCPVALAASCASGISPGSANALDEPGPSQKRNSWIHPTLLRL